MAIVRTPASIVKRERSADQDADLTPLPWLLTAFAVLGVVVGGGLLALWLTNRWADQHIAGVAATDAPLVSVRLDAIKTALTVAAGLGAGVTLLLALRRQAMSERAQRTAERAQRHVELAAERSHRLAEQDAAERRITELYVAAVEQLGSDKAPVRLGGLYALERIGNDHPKMRQTVMDVWCAYLRMPYTPPAEVLRRNAEHSPSYLALDADEPEPTQQPDRREELQVRLTAQSLIRTHLYSSDEADTEPAEYWRGPGSERMNLDLGGAVLINFMFMKCQLGALTATNAQFHGGASLSEAQFHGGASLSRAQFHGDASLSRVQFHAGVVLFEVRFHGDVHLSEARFPLGAMLDQAQFRGNAYLTKVQFHRLANLTQVQFHGDADLSEAQFHREVSLSEARFHGNADLSEAQFHGRTVLIKTQFRSEASLATAQFDRTPAVKGMRVSNRAVLPVGWTSSTEPDPEGLFEVLTATATPGPDDQRPDNDTQPRR